MTPSQITAVQQITSAVDGLLWSVRVATMNGTVYLTGTKPGRLAESFMAWIGPRGGVRVSVASRASLVR